MTNIPQRSHKSINSLDVPIEASGAIHCPKCSGSARMTVLARFNRVGIKCFDCGFVADPDEINMIDFKKVA